MVHHKSSHVSKILNQSVDKLSVSNETYYGSSSVHSSIMSRSLADTPHIEIDNHLEKDKKTSSIPEESTPCHIEKMEDLTFDPESFSQHVEPSKVNFWKLYHTPLHKEFTYCLRHKFKPHNNTHQSSLVDTYDLYQYFMKTSSEAQACTQGSYDLIASFLEGSYRKYIQHNGKSVSNAYPLLQIKGGNKVLIFSIYLTAQFQCWLLILISYLIVGLELMWWLHWLYDYTWHSMSRCS